MAIAIPAGFFCKQGPWIINAGLLFLGFFLFVYLLIPVRDEEESFAVHGKKPPKFAYETIGCGPLALNGLRSYIPLSSLRTELMVLGKNARPDAIQKTVLLGLKSANEEKVVLDGETVYLRPLSEGQFSFSSEKTPFFVRPILLEEGVLVEVGKGQDTGSLLVKDILSLPLTEEPVHASTLKKASAWGHDVLLESYGGEEYFSFREKMRLEFGEGASSYVCFVEPGDLLIWTEEKWQPVSLENFSHRLPLARITAASSREIDIEAWDETGFHPISVKIAIKTPPRLPGKKLGEVFTALRPRTASEITCLLDRKRVVLKEGDWWLKTENGWHNLKSLHEIESLVQHKIRGELVIFDRLENERGKPVLKGHLFDSMRTHMQPVSLTVNSEKKGKGAKKKKAESPARARNLETEIKP